MQGDRAVKQTVEYRSDSEDMPRKLLDGPELPYYKITHYFYMKKWPEGVFNAYK